jgi:hypothetical protein
MNNKKIIIKAIDNTNKEYLAFYMNEFLKSTFFVQFNDNIFGAVTLHHFFEMIKNKFEGENLEMVISNEKLEFKNQALVELFNQKEEVK